MLAGNAFGFTSAQAGPYVEIAGGLGITHPDLAAGAGWEAGAGVWIGKYDDVYAIGKYTSFGITLRQDYSDGLHTATMLEVRRGFDIIVAFHFFVAGGAEVIGNQLHWTARLGGGIKYRFTRFWGAHLRLELGATVGQGVVGARAGLVLGVVFSRPFSKVSQGD